MPLETCPYKYGPVLLPGLPQRSKMLLIASGDCPLVTAHIDLAVCYVVISKVYQFLSIYQDLLERISNIVLVV